MRQKKIGLEKFRPTKL